MEWKKVLPTFRQLHTHYIEALVNCYAFLIDIAHLQHPPPPLYTLPLPNEMPSFIFNMAASRFAISVSLFGPQTQNVNLKIACNISHTHRQRR